MRSKLGLVSSLAKDLGGETWPIGVNCGRETYLNVTIIPLAKPRCGYSFQLRATSLRSVESLSSFKNGYIDPPFIKVTSATKVLKQMATGTHVAQLTSRREKSQKKGPRLLHADDAAMEGLWREWC